MLPGGSYIQKPRVYQAFYLNYYHHDGNKDRNMKNSIKSKNYPKSKTLMELEKFNVD